MLLVRVRQAGGVAGDQNEAHERTRRGGLTLPAMCH
jgi:hypothetical protein